MIIKSNIIRQFVSWTLRRPGHAFALIVSAHLLPVWAFPYVPTQDGPSHLSNATILRRFRAEGSRYGEFYELRNQVLPNWTSHILLSGLLGFLTAPTSEKMLASLYIVLLAAATRHYLGQFGDETRRLAPLALLLVYNRCFLMGFYNYCLSLAIFFFVLGEGLRLRGRFGFRAAVGLSMTLIAAFFTHLIGFALATFGAVWIAALSPVQRTRNLAAVGLAALPASALAIRFMTESGFVGEGGALHGLASAWRAMRGPGIEPALDLSISLNDQLFGPYEDHRFPLGLLALLGVLYVGLASRFAAPARPAGGSPGPAGPRVAMLILAAMFLVVFAMMPEHLGAHGGFIPARIAPLPFLIGLGCLRVPSDPWLRRLASALTALALVINVAMVTLYFREANQDLAEFVAARDFVGGGGQTVATLRRAARPGALVKPLEHASDLYCAGTWNINFDNYEAATGHFPVRFRRGLPMRQDGLADEIRMTADVLLVWGNPPEAITAVRDGDYRETFRRGRLRVLERSRGVAPKGPARTP